VYCVALILAASASLLSAQNGPGVIRGTLTYLFNFDQGNQPDTGARVALVSGKLDVPPTAIVSVYPGMLIFNGKKTVKTVKFTIADGSGNFSLQDVPAGEYTLLLKSNHAKALTQRDVSGKIVTMSVTVNSGETVDMSHDFGMSTTPSP
jgi:hypothetical protein